MAREFASGRKFTAKGLDAVIARKWRELESFINTQTARFDDDGTLTLPSGLAVVGDLDVDGTADFAGAVDVHAGIDMNGSGVTAASGIDIENNTPSRGTLRLVKSGTNDIWYLYWSGGPNDGSVGEVQVFGNSGDALKLRLVDGVLQVDAAGSTIAQEAWTEPSTLLNSWVTYSGTFHPFGYMKDSMGFVHLRGLIKSGTANGIYTLPAGYRPAKTVMFATATNPSGTSSRVDVTAAGGVSAISHSNVFLSLEGMSFAAA